MIKKTKILSRYIVIPDTPGGLVDRPAFECVLQAIELIKPTGVIHLGDIGEWACVNHHRFKRNHFHVLTGELKICHDQGETILKEGESYEVLPPNKHCFVGMTDALVIETVYVKLEDADIIRETQGGKENAI